ncbi:DivIVA domain-containing protein [Dactylosporangium aurantiacum]|uniref:Cell wall synthesis protein Wag31 n=1 Tax=Dactylosporangium aurantiacum TaxID=35754 RepID=A0A9Q9IID7_9ACTN|nr:DivIVA domain-containing protein [Dactylosporangium aurantiacum]MDG6104602.1 DivIVA domain-containing protein [Dactylosporangium aurantiacum]UWZ56206.1 DivIVA domain-containing protein [Dactylosporangium aurantiacum]
MMLTPADVQAVRFTKAAFGKRGYDEDEVDAFLDVVAQALTALHDELAALRGAPAPDASFGTSTAAESAMLAELDRIKQRLSRLEAAVRN